MRGMQIDLDLLELSLEIDLDSKVEKSYSCIKDQWSNGYNNALICMCRGSELFSGLRSVTRVHFCMCFHHTNFVCGSAIQVGIVIAVHCIYCIQYPIYMRISTVESACASSCGVWLAQWSVRMNARRAYAGSSPSAVHDRHFSSLY